MHKSFHLSSGMKKNLQDPEFQKNFQPAETQVKTASSKQIRQDIFSILLSASEKLDSLGLEKSAVQILMLHEMAHKELQKSANLQTQELFLTLSEEKK